MQSLVSMLVPELILVGMGLILMLLGCSKRASSRALAPWLALLALVAVSVYQLANIEAVGTTVISAIGSLRYESYSYYIRFLTPLIGIMLLLLAWPTDRDRTGNSALFYGQDAGEFFALFLLSISGLMLVGIANDLIILFLALELVSIPTYVMVSMSRPSAVAQEAGVKYFFLGALSVALMLLGFSYLYGATGQINLAEISVTLQARAALSPDHLLPTIDMLGVLLILLGLAFKMAAFPLHFYAGDVYEGAATPVTAFLAFVPKTAGFVALIKLLYVVGGADFNIPLVLNRLLWILAILTMSVGNVLALMQNNVKRVLAYSSVAHSGYMLVGIAALAYVPNTALVGVLFYLAAYGLMNSAAFGVLILLPNRDGRGSAETYEDLAGQGRRHVGLGLAMAVACFSLIGMPATVGFPGKLLLIRPAWQADMVALVIILVVNAAVSAAYYLRIVGSMFLRTDAAEAEASTETGIACPVRQQFAVGLGVGVSALGTLLIGTLPFATEGIIDQARMSAHLQSAVVVYQPAPAEPDAELAE